VTAVVASWLDVCSGAEPLHDEVGVAR